MLGDEAMRNSRCATVDALLLVLCGTSGAFPLGLPAGVERMIATRKFESRGVELTSVPSHRLAASWPTYFTEHWLVAEFYLKCEEATVEEMQTVMKRNPSYVGHLHCDWGRWEHARAAIPLLHQRHVLTLLLAGVCRVLNSRSNMRVLQGSAPTVAVSNL